MSENIETLLRDLLGEAVSFNEGKFVDKIKGTATAVANKVIPHRRKTQQAIKPVMGEDDLDEKNNTNFVIAVMNTVITAQMAAKLVRKKAM